MRFTRRSFSLRSSHVFISLLLASSVVAHSPEEASDIKDVIAGKNDTIVPEAKEVHCDPHDPCCMIHRFAVQSRETRNFEIGANFAYECLSTLPFDSERSVTMVKGLRKFVTAYSAQTFFKNPPAPELDMERLNFDRELEKIQKRAEMEDGFDNNYEFDKAIMDLFNAFNDFHVSYNPACSRIFPAFYHDFPIVAIKDKDHRIPRIHLVDRHTGKVKEEVRRVNGENVYSYLLKMVKHSNELHWIDPDARFNALLYTRGAREADVMLGKFASREVYSKRPLVIETANGRKHRAHWKVYIKEWPLKLHSKESLAKACRPVDAVTSTLAYLTPEQIQTVLKELEKSGGTKETEDSEKAKALVKPGVDDSVKMDIASSLGTAHAESPRAHWWPKPLIGTKGSEFTVHILDHETAVLSIQTFTPRTKGMDNKHFAKYWHEVLASAKQQLKDREVKKLIIDLATNDGGAISLGMSTLHTLFPKAKPWYAMDSRRSELTDTLLKKENLTLYEQLDTKPFASFEELLGPVQKFGDNFTREARWNPERFIKSQIDFDTDNNAENFLPAKDVVYVTNGRCGSTCAVFAEALDKIGVRSLAYGGRPSKWIRPMQSVGGVKGMEVLYYSHARVKAANVTILPPLPMLAEVSVNFRNSYAPDRKLPNEFIYQPADYHFYLTHEMHERVESIWRAVKDIAWNQEGEPTPSMFDKHHYHNQQGLFQAMEEVARLKMQAKQEAYRRTKGFHKSVYYEEMSVNQRPYTIIEQVQYGPMGMEKMPFRIGELPPPFNFASILRELERQRDEKEEEGEEEEF